MRNVDITSFGGGEVPLPIAPDSVRASILIVTDFTLIKIQLNDTFMQMFSKLLLAYNSDKVSWIFIFRPSLSLFLKLYKWTITFHIVHQPQEVHKEEVKETSVVILPLRRAAVSLLLL
jgi:hypothetical protein